MTDPTLIPRLAREAGLPDIGYIVGEGPTPVSPELTRFAELVAEECAKVAEDCGKPSKLAGPVGGYFIASGACIARAIREQFKEQP